MTERSFYASPSRIVQAQIAAPMLVVGATLNFALGTPASALGGVVAIGLAGSLFWSLRHRRRPSVEISDRAVAWQPCFGFSARRVVDIREIEAVAMRNPRTLRLTTRGGETVDVSLAEIARDERPQVCEAIEQCLE